MPRRRYAIASAVLQHLSSALDCRMLFATHYAALTAEFAASPRVALGHMAAVVGGNRRLDGATAVIKLESYLRVSAI